MKNRNLHSLSKKYIVFIFIISCFLHTTITSAATSERSSDVDPFTLVNAYDTLLNYQSNKEVIIAVIDTGVDVNHEDLQDAIWTNSSEIADNGIDDDNNGYIDDIHGWNFYNDSNIVCNYNKLGKSDPKNNDNHGTHVAGIIAANANNRVGITGLASNINVKIMPLKVTGGENGTGKTSSLIKAIRYASDMGASICNISLNSSQYTEELYMTMLQSPMLFVCSAGNGNESENGVNIDKKKTYPASFQLPNVISIAAINSDGTNIANYSNYGVQSVALAAPGTCIYSTLVGNQYGVSTGTSMATPFVSATSAILMTMNQRYYPSEIKQILMATVTPLSSLKNKVASGGLLNVDQAVSYAYIALHEKDKTPPKLTITQTEKKVDLAVSDTESGVQTISYLYGKRQKTDFKKGRLGKPITELSFSLNAGTYTFYACDHEGNETIKTITIK